MGKQWDGFMSLRVSGLVSLLRYERGAEVSTKFGHHNMLEAFGSAISPSQTVHCHQGAEGPRQRAASEETSSRVDGNHSDRVAR